MNRLQIGIYFFHLVVVSLALGSVFVRLPKLLRMSEYARFLFGVAITPFVLGVWAVVFAFIAPGAAPFVFPAIPFVVSLCILLCVGRVTGVRLLRLMKAIPVAKRRRCALSILMAFAVVAVLGDRLVRQSLLPLTQHDSLIYANEALAFAKNRKTSAIPNFRAGLYDVAPAHPHGFIYQAYLAEALMFVQGRSRIGFPNDAAMRFSIQILIAYLVLALLVCGLVLIDGEASLVSGFLLLSAPFLYHMSYASSRDAFRLIPLLLLIAALAPPLKHKKLSPRRLIGTFAVAGMMIWVSIQAHTLNILMVATICLTWLIMGVVVSLPRKTMAYFCLSSAFGGALGVLHYVWNYVDTGRLMGFGFAYYAYEGTALWSALFHTPSYSRATNLSIVDRFWAIESVHGFFYTAGGIVLSVVIQSVALFDKRRPGRQWIPIVWGSLILIGSWVPVTGMFDVGKMGLSTMFVVNARYMLYVAPLTVLLAGATIFLLKSRLRQMERLMPVILIATGAIALLRIAHWKTLTSEEANSVAGLAVARYFESIPTDKRVVLDKAGTAYYLRQETAYIYAGQAWALVRAGTSGAVQKLLTEMAVDYVLLERPLIGWWDQVPLGQYLESSHALVKDGHSWRLYGVSDSE